MTEQTPLELLLEELDKASASDAASMLVMMLVGPPRDASDPRAKEQIESMYRLAKIGMMVVLQKKDFIGILREHGTRSDDTMLEDDLTISAT